MKIIDHTAEDAHWRENHPTQAFAGGADYEDYRHAYQTGYAGYDPKAGQNSFEEVEGELRMEYEGGAASLEWEKAQLATKAAWERARDVYSSAITGGIPAQTVT